MAAFLLSLREGLEAALIIGILLGAVRRIDRSELGRFIWFGMAAGFLTGMIVWMRRQGASWRASLTAGAREAAIITGGWGLFAIAFLAVARKQAA